MFLISDLAGERRFASSGMKQVISSLSIRNIFSDCFLCCCLVSKRLESLGALTHADRRATETRNLSQFNVENKYGKDALRSILEHYIGFNKFTLNDFNGDEYKFGMFHKVRMAMDDVGIEHPIENVNMTRFLNRILGMPVDVQNYLFSHFMQVMEDIIERAKRDGKFEMGIMGEITFESYLRDLERYSISLSFVSLILMNSFMIFIDLGNTDKAEKIKSIRFFRKHASGVAPVDLTTVALERGIPWEDALKM